MNTNLKKVQIALNHYLTDNGNSFSIIETDNDDIQMLTLIRDDITEFAIIATADDKQLLFNVALFDTGQILDNKQHELNQMMLELNIAMPLSSFALTGKHYSIFGALSMDSNAEQIQEEILVLSDNILDALEVCQPFLN